MIYHGRLCIIYRGMYDVSGCVQSGVTKQTV